MNNSPALGKALEDQRENSPDVALLPRQVPMSKNQRSVRTHESKFEGGEFELTHGAAVRIAFFVPRKDLVPPPGDATCT
jgi:hypothetical protein